MRIYLGRYTTNSHWVPSKLHRYFFFLDFFFLMHFSVTNVGYGDREGLSSVHLVLSWPRHINSWERDIMSWPRDHFVEVILMSWPRDVMLRELHIFSRGHEFNA